MSDDLQSIEDLLKGGGPSGTTPTTKKTSDKNVQNVLAKKVEEISKKEKEVETERQAQGAGVPYVQLKGFAISPEAIKQIPQTQAEELQAVCFLYTGPEVRIGAINPADEKVKEVAYQIGERLHANVGIYQISAESLAQAIKLYAMLPKIVEHTTGVKITADELNKYSKEIESFADLQKMIAKVSTTEFLALILAAAIKIKASDVHIEAEEKDVKVRFRVDGILEDVAELPKDLWKQIISRIKLVAGLKINITNKPQDGRFTIYIGEEKVDVRTSALPTAYGESVVMRLLMSGSINLDFGDLGIRPLVFEKLRKEIEKPNGMIITTGPTGSGKTTTLYAVLQRLNKPGVKIITLEDPVEYKLAGINQSQIDHTKEYTFAKGLRSILRQDPDIVMVGEIRDLETAEISIQAALTGHLMLSTIHTNDAAGAIPRFLSMGAKGFLLAPALNAIVGQRLVRRVCESCKQTYSPEPEVLDRIKKILATIPEKSGEKPDITTAKFSKGGGCEICNHTGFKGRVGIYEILIVDDAVEKAIQAEDVSEYKMREIATAQGMVTMVQDGILKVLDGLTTPEEVFRVAEE